MNVANDPAYLAAKRLWQDLGPDRDLPVQARQACVPGCDPLLTEIDDLVKAPVRGDSSRIYLLASYGFLTTSRSEDGHTLVYHLVAQEPEPDTRSWVEIEQARIDREVAAERAFREREWEHQRRAQEILAEPQRRLEQLRMNEALAAVGLAPQELHQRLARIEARLDQLGRLLGVQDDDNNSGPREAQEVTQ